MTGKINRNIVNVRVLLCRFVCQFGSRGLFNLLAITRQAEAVEGRDIGAAHANRACPRVRCPGPVGKEGRKERDAATACLQAAPSLVPPAVAVPLFAHKIIWHRTTTSTVVRYA